MKKFIIATLMIIAIICAIPPIALGFSVLNLGHAVKVATSLSAKLACSGYFISGFEHTQIMKDLASYSPVTNMVNLEYNDDEKSVSANLFGLAPVIARYRTTYGCSLVYPGVSALNESPAEIDSIPTEYHLQAWPLGQARPDLQPHIMQRLQELAQQDNNKGLNTRALVVIKNGKLVGEYYAQNTTPKTPLLGWSMAKSVTAMTIGRMEKLGLIEQPQIIDVPPAVLFEEWQTDNRNGILLADLLNMTSGLQFDETYAPGSDATHMLFTAPSASDIAIQSPLQHAAGSHFSYSSGTSNLLARYIFNRFEHSPQKVQQFIHQQLLQPAGVSTLTFETDATGVPLASSYIYASAPDWARLGLLMANRGVINGQQLLNQEWVIKATTPNKSNNETAYGYQFWLNKGDSELRWPSLPKDAFAMMGNRKQSVMIIPSQNTVLVRLGWSSGDYPMEQHYASILGELN